MQPRGTPGFAPGHHGSTLSVGIGSVPPGSFPSFLRAECDVTTEQESAFRTNETETTDSAGKFRLRAICDPDRKTFIVTLKFYRTENVNLQHFTLKKKVFFPWIPRFKIKVNVTASCVTFCKYIKTGETMNDKKCTNFIYQSTNPIYYEIQSQRQIYINGESELLKYQTIMVSFRKKRFSFDSTHSSISSAKRRTLTLTRIHLIQTWTIGITVTPSHPCAFSLFA